MTDSKVEVNADVLSTLTSAIPIPNSGGGGTSKKNRKHQGKGRSEKREEKRALYELSQSLREDE